jgi:hypothetical protein
MTNAYRDENSVPTKIGVLDTNGIDIMRMYVNPQNGALKVMDGTSGTYPGGNIAKRDGNSVPTMIGVSTIDQKTPLKALINSSHELLIKST